MPVHDDLGLRMKTHYEYTTTLQRLVRRMPVIIRVDGRAFHSFTHGFRKPYDKLLMETMQETMLALCKNIPSCVLGYTQSDEISLVLVDYKELNTEPWFENKVHKLTSISSSLATVYFNKIFKEKINKISDSKENEMIEMSNVYIKAIDTKMPIFDSRVFNIPREEVTNYFLWRQLDATRNSIQMAGQAYFSHKQLQNKTCDMIQEMLHEEKGINWNDYPTDFKRGSCAIKVMRTIESKNGEMIDRAQWTIDHNIPQFKGEDRSYIDNLILLKE